LVAEGAALAVEEACAEGAVGVAAADAIDGLPRSHGPQISKSNWGTDRKGRLE
jgi:hypothetical protein